MGVFVLIEVFAFQIPLYTVSLPNVRSFRCGSLVLGSGSLSLVMDVLFPERYALHDPLAMPRSRRCNPSYVIRQPVILQRVHILFHHFRLLATTSIKESVRTHIHRISKSVNHLATAIGGELARLTAQVWSIWAKLYALHQHQEPLDCSLFNQVCGRHVAYRLSEVPTDSTLEWVETGIPHPDSRLELESICSVIWLYLVTLARARSGW